MPIISQKDADVIRSLFEKELKDSVKVDYFTEKGAAESGPPSGDCQYCKETGELLAEVSALSPQIQLTVHEETTAAVPAFELQGKNQGRVRYLGIPAGYEFSSLIEDIVDVSTGMTKLSAATKAALRELMRPVHIQVFVTPT